MVPRVAAAGRVRREVAELLRWAEAVETLAFQTEGRIGGKGENSIIACEGKIVLGASFVPTSPQPPCAPLGSGHKQLGGRAPPEGDPLLFKGQACRRQNWHLAVTTKEAVLCSRELGKKSGGRTGGLWGAAGRSWQGELRPGCATAPVEFAV